VLQTVNSVRFAPARRIQSVFDAVQLIGFEVVRALVLSIQVFEFCKSTSRTDLFQTVWSHSLRTAVRAKRLAEFEGLSMEACEETFLLGLLHDVGKVILGSSCPEQYQALWAQFREHSAGLIEAEHKDFEADHAQVGALLLRLWGLPETVSAGVEMHHSIEALELQEFCPLIAVHLAQELAPGRWNPAVNDKLISHLGLELHLADWREIVQKESRAPLTLAR
jgi:putative nucleotidyltransferase with HDIG domain